MVNDTTTLTGALAQLGETMATNLQEMGVSADASDGLTTLASKILDIEQSGVVTKNVVLTCNKDILSFYHSESCTLEATVRDGNNNLLANETVEFFNGLISMGTATTNSNGVATKSYTSTGAGDISFTAECSSFVSETYEVEDCLYVNTGETSSLTIDSGVSCTIEDGAIKITKNTSGEKFVNCSYDFVSQDHEIIFTIPKIDSNTNVPLGFAVYRGTTQIYWAGYNKSNGRFDTKNGSKTTSLNVGDTIRILKSGSNLTAYINNEIISTVSTASSGIRLGFYTNSGYVQYIDNIKVKAIS